MCEVICCLRVRPGPAGDGGSGVTGGGGGGGGEDGGVQWRPLAVLLFIKMKRAHKSQRQEVGSAAFRGTNSSSLNGGGFKRGA